MNNITQCKKCLLHNGVPGISINDESTCNICDFSDTQRHFNKYSSAKKEFENFSEQLDVINKKYSDSKYSVCIMFSGGKDSIYMLNRFSKVNRERTLALNIDLPYESHSTEESIQKVISKLDVDFLRFKPSMVNYRKFMKKIFTGDFSVKSNDSENYGIVKYAHQTPCILCSCFIQLSACLVAARYKIPYLMYCADHTQLVTMPMGVDEILATFRNYLEEDFIISLFSEDIYLLDREKNPNVPKMIYPYVGVADYNSEKLIAELRADGLYDTSPVQTHCKLWSLLHYYTYKKYNIPFYILNMAGEVRNQLHIKPQIEYLIKQFQEIMEMSEGELTPDNHGQIKKALGLVYSDPKDIDYLYNNIIELKQMAETFDFKLNDIM